MVGKLNRRGRGDSVVCPYFFFYFLGSPRNPLMAAELTGSDLRYFAPNVVCRAWQVGLPSPFAESHFFFYFLLFCPYLSSFLECGNAAGAGICNGHGRAATVEGGQRGSLRYNPIMTVSLNHLILPDAERAPADAVATADAAAHDDGGTPVSAGARRKPAWLKMKMPAGDGYVALLELVKEKKLHTVCQSAMCPNLGECWAAGTATLMILGDICTRSCGFCHIATGRPGTLDLDEPRRVGQAVAKMKLRHAVITSVNRDELPDGGAGVWAHTIRQIREHSPGTSVEVLIPDFCGKWEALQTVLDERPEILNHNIETIERLYKTVRPQAKYARSLELLAIAKKQRLTTKTGFMLGLGETAAEIEQVLRDLVAKQVDIVTIGQYLQPTPKHLPVARWAHPDEFAQWKIVGEKMGLKHVESGPMVRSSYHAEKQVPAAR